ncbi:hypothetical protein, partial [Streptomyces sp. NPDC017964]|uniref:hypothetical protein n=1 Tax=Streptomyces sp. NPDC017964 TaxID=3365022 RepID=UPI0037BCB840
MVDLVQMIDTDHLSPRRPLTIEITIYGWSTSTPAVLRGLTWGNVERWECIGQGFATDGFCPP